MKARTKNQKRVVELSRTLPALTTKQKQWVQDHCFGDYDGFRNNTSTWCIHCGEVFTTGDSALVDTVIGEAVCPKCGRKLKVQQSISRRKRFNEKWYFTIITTCKEWQVCRHFIAEFYALRGTGESHLFINEAVQNWINEKGEEVIFARPVKAMSKIYDNWDWSKAMDVRIKRLHPFGVGIDKYSINSRYILPGAKVLPIIKRNGYSSKLLKVAAPDVIFKTLIKNREAEMLVKTSQLSLFRYKLSKDINLSRYAHSINICNRNGYVVADASMWIDYLDLLDYFHLDTHNAYYVCPKDLKAVHDRLVRNKARIEAKRLLAEKMEKAAKWEDDYRKHKSRFFGICFGNKDIIITVIQSVAEMAEEGCEMHHCVFANEYFKRKDSLILSAKDKAGKRLETIEVSLKTFKVVQSRAVHNGITQYHDQIIKLMNENINLIKKVA